MFGSARRQGPEPREGRAILVVIPSKRGQGGGRAQGPQQAGPRTQAGACNGASVCLVLVSAWFSGTVRDGRSWNSSGRLVLGIAAQLRVRRGNGPETVVNGRQLPTERFSRTKLSEIDREVVQRRPELAERPIKRKLKCCTALTCQSYRKSNVSPSSVGQSAEPSKVHPHTS